MSIYTGPEITNSGLVFHYDMINDQKSWKGKPTTNLIKYPDWTTGTDNNFSGWIRDNTNINVVKDTYLGKSCIKLTRASGDTGWNGIAGEIIQLQPNTTYTETINYAVPASMSQPIRFYLPEFNSSNAVINYRHYLTAQSATNEWQTFTYTFTTDATATSWGKYKIDWNTTASTQLETIYIQNIQLEQNSYATPFVNGTRSNTQAIIDLTKNNTITINSLNYLSNNKFNFDGTNSFYIPTIDFSNEQTIEIWLKPTENDDVRRNPYDQAYAGFGTWTHEPSGNINYYYGDGGANNSPYIGHMSSFVVSQNEIACVCTTRNTTESWWYKNGVKYNSYQHTYGSLTATPGNITIGSGYAGGYIGDIYAVKIYDRALTEAEVKQNFESTRSRYGI